MSKIIQALEAEQTAGKEFPDFVHQPLFRCIYFIPIPILQTQQPPRALDVFFCTYSIKDFQSLVPLLTRSIVPSYRIEQPAIFEIPLRGLVPSVYLFCQIQALCKISFGLLPFIH